MPQYDRIKDRQYTLQDSVTKEHIRRTRSFTEAFQPGRCVIMAALFPDENSNNGSHCPGCHRENAGSPDREVRWYVITDSTYYNEFGHELTVR